MPEGISTSIRSGVKPRIPGPKAPSPPAISKPVLMKAADGRAPLRERMLARRNDQIGDYSNTIFPVMALGILFSDIIWESPFLIPAGLCLIMSFIVISMNSSPQAIIVKLFRKHTRHPEAKFEEAQEYRRLLDSGLISEDAYHVALKKLYPHLPEMKSLALSATEAGRGKVK